MIFGQADKGWSQPGLTYTYVDSLDKQSPDFTTVTVIGQPVIHLVKKGDTLLDIARDYRLGYNEMADLYPGIDPWIPPAGKELVIPSMWVIPHAARSGILINLAELRLYHFLDRKSMVKTPSDNIYGDMGRVMSVTKNVRTYPVGIGDEQFTSPIGSFQVIDKRTKPYWYIPPSLQEKYAPVKVFPPGPNNPLGDYFMGIGNAYGIHGTDIPWSVGRLVTHGCIRLYPEDIEVLYPSVPVGTPVEIIYEPVKIGFRKGKIYAEIHKDIYNMIPDFHRYGLRKVEESGLMEVVDIKRFEDELTRKSGIPVEVGEKWFGIAHE